MSSLSNPLTPSVDYDPTWLNRLKELMPDAVAWYEHWFPGDPPGMAKPGEVPGRGLYPYQLELLLAIERAVMLAYYGLDGPKELASPWSRQTGKNETDARWTHRGLTLIGGMQVARGLPMAYMVKSAPTWEPQIDQSQRRIEGLLESLEGWEGTLRKRKGYIYWLSDLKCALAFLSANKRSTKKGETANILQVLDETQDTTPGVYHDDLEPMRASKSAPALFQGTQGPEGCLMDMKLEELRDIERRTGEKLIYNIPWEVAAQFNPGYGDTVRKVIKRLGIDHPIVRTNYRCLSARAIDKFLTEKYQFENLQGDHPRLKGPRPGKIYVAGGDFCGASETEDVDDLWDSERVEKRDSSVFGIGELGWEEDDEGLIAVVDLVDVLWLPGLYPDTVVDKLLKYLFGIWGVARAALDARGVGEGPAFSIHKHHQNRVDLIKSTSTDVSLMGYRLLGAINSKRFRCFKNDGSREYQEFWTQFRELRRRIMPGPGGTGGVMRWAAPTRRVLVNGENSVVHDDCPKMCGYLMRAAENHLAHVIRQYQEKKTVERYDAGAAYM